MSSILIETKLVILSNQLAVEFKDLIVILVKNINPIVLYSDSQMDAVRRILYTNNWIYELLLKELFELFGVPNDQKLVTGCGGNVVSI